MPDIGLTSLVVVLVFWQQRVVNQIIVTMIIVMCFVTMQSERT